MIQMSDVSEAARMSKLDDAMQHLLKIAAVEPDGRYHNDLWYAYSQDERVAELLRWMKAEDLVVQ